LIPRPALDERWARPPPRQTARRKSGSKMREEMIYLLAEATAAEPV